MALNVIGLISGGKDSLYSLVHCLENGHRIVALANLYPGPQRQEDSSATSIVADQTSGVPASACGNIGKDNGTDDRLDNGHGKEEEDINSFMYQTVGHSVVPLYAEALGLPLYRHEIRGLAVQAGRYYDASAPNNGLDETEDLFALLTEVLKHHPEANAVCSGAILSTYQRTRVESVALRLDLAPLAYLWQYPALPPPAERLESLTGLLDDMDAAGCDARLIKIASGGIKERLLWSNVADTRTRQSLVTGLSPFFEGQEFWLRGAVLGEGGEYETLAIDGPRNLWKKRISFPEADISTFSGEGGASYARMSQAKLVTKDDGGSREALRCPCLLDGRFLSVQRRLVASSLDAGKNVGKEIREKMSVSPQLPYQPGMASVSTGPSIYNLQCKEQGADPSDQMKSIVRQATELIRASPNADSESTMQASDVVFCLLLLKDMSEFSKVNSVYGRLWPKNLPNPPARVTVATPLPEGVAVSLSIILDRGQRDQRKGLHVQSRSYWAPANIGPYSQAVSCPLFASAANTNVHDTRQLEVVHMAGQIPLVPRSMELLSGPLAEQAVLSLQHLWRIGQDREVDLWTTGVAFLEQGTESLVERSHMMVEIWEQAHVTSTRVAQSPAAESDDDEADFDVWNLQRGNGRFMRAMPRETVGEHLHVLPNESLFQPDPIWMPPLVVAEVTTLPRNAPVEWWSTGVAGVAANLQDITTAVHQQVSRPWGDVSAVSLEQKGHDSDGNERCSKRTSFVTVCISLALEGAAAAASSREAVPPDASTLMKMLDTTRSCSSQAFTSEETHTVLHGTTFAILSSLTKGHTSEGQASLSKATAVVPCHRLCSQKRRQAGADTNDVEEISVAVLLCIQSISAKV